MMMDSEILKTVLEDYGTPCYFFDEARFEMNILNFRNALDRFSPKNIIGYSFKTNYAPAICRLARDLDCYAEVVSRMELELAERLGFATGSIIFNGPLKSISDIEHAVRMGAVVNLDNLEQVNAVCSMNDVDLVNSKFGLRVNVDLAEKLLAKKLALGGLLPRFGMRRTELDSATDVLKAKGVEIVALHGHSSSSDRACENYGAIVSELLSVRERYGLDSVRYLDIGGGFYGKVPEEFGIQDVPSFSDYARCAGEACMEDSWFRRHEPTLVIEPGMSVVADAVSYATTVVSSRETGGRCVLGVDGSFFDIRPTWHKKILPHRLLSKMNSDEKKLPYTVVGSTCMERDILFEEALLPEVRIGDALVVGNVGAYCGVLRPDFINYSPPVVSVSKEGVCSVVKKRQDFEDFFSSYGF